jgi:hypothetical protein
MLKQLFLMHPQDLNALIEQSIQQAKLLDDKFVADETFPGVVLCSSSPNAQKMAHIIASKFSLRNWAIPVEIISSLDDYDDNPREEKDIQVIKDLDAAMLQHSVVLVVTSPRRVIGISKVLGQDIRLANSECLIYERQQSLTGKASPLTLVDRIKAIERFPGFCKPQPTRSFPKKFLYFVHDHITSRGLRIGALVSSAGLAGLGIITEVDGRFGLSGITEMKVVAGLAQPSVHIPLPCVKQRGKMSSGLGKTASNGERSIVYETVSHISQVFKDFPR